MKQPKLLTVDDLVIGKKYAMSTIQQPNQDPEIYSINQICTNITDKEIEFKTKSGNSHQYILKKDFDDKQEKTIKGFQIPIYEYDDKKSLKENAQPWQDYLKEQYFECLKKDFGTTKDEVINELIQTYINISINPFTKLYFKEFFGELEDE